MPPELEDDDEIDSASFAAAVLRKGLEQGVLHA